MNFEKEYEKLLSDYKNLQLRVTRFNAVEQELINTKEQLNKEVELYKQVHNYTMKALKAESEDELFKIIGEAIIDILDFESSIVFFKSYTNSCPNKIFAEGFEITNESTFQDIEDLFNISKDNTVSTFQSATLLKYISFSHLSIAIGIRFTEKILGYKIYFLGAVSTQKSAFYTPLESRHTHIFLFLLNKMHLVFANWKRSEQIENQVQQITKSENELRKLSLIATNTKNGVIITDKLGAVEWVNAAFTESTGYQLEEVIGKKPKDFLQGQETTNEQIRKLSSSLANKQDIDLIITNYTKTGKKFFNQLQIVAVHDNNGNHINFIAIQKDITDEIKVKNEIVKINERFELISNHTNAGVWELDIATKEVYWSSALYKIFGLDANKNYSNRLEFLDTLVYPEDMIERQKKLLNLINGFGDIIRYQFRILRESDGALRYIQSTAIAEKDKNGKTIRLIGNSQDITELKELEAKLISAVKEKDESLNKINELKSFYERVLNHSPSHIVVFDKQLRLTFANSTPERSDSNWRNLLNVTLDDILKKISDIQIIEICKQITLAIKEHKQIQLETNFINNKNTKVIYLNTIQPYFDINGDIENVIIMGVDITQQKNIEKNIIEKNEELRKINLELDNFVYSISHDLRSPLLSIKGIASLILQGTELSKENFEFLNMILTSVEKLDNNIQEILEYSHNSRAEIVRKEFDLKKLVISVFNDLKFAITDEIILNINASENTVIKSDEARLSMLLKNIIGNSIKYRKIDRTLQIDVVLNVSLDCINLTITDNGEGISETHLARVFEMFYRATTTSIGTGLGLYICKEIINKLAGKIDIKSEINKGTSVAISFPHSY